jgi:hypothetical protein
MRIYITTHIDATGKNTVSGVWTQKRLAWQAIIARYGEDMLTCLALGARGERRRTCTESALAALLRAQDGPVHAIDGRERSVWTVMEIDVNQPREAS